MARISRLYYLLPPSSILQLTNFPADTLARTVASLPHVDWILIDCEHGNIDDAAMYHSVAAVVQAGCSPIVRIKGCEGWMVKRALDAGVSSYSCALRCLIGC